VPDLWRPARPAAARHDGGRRDFASVSGMRASRYDLQVDDEVADEAARLLA
jgi:hypothetical protein